MKTFALDADQQKCTHLNPGHDQLLRNVENQSQTCLPLALQFTYLNPLTDLKNKLEIMVALPL